MVLAEISAEIRRCKKKNRILKYCKMRISTLNKNKSSSKIQVTEKCKRFCFKQFFFINSIFLPFLNLKPQFQLADQKKKIYLPAKNKLLGSSELYFSLGNPMELFVQKGILRSLSYKSRVAYLL